MTDACLYTEVAPLKYLLVSVSPGGDCLCNEQHRISGVTVSRLRHINSARVKMSNSGLRRELLGLISGFIVIKGRKLYESTHLFPRAVAGLSLQFIFYKASVHWMSISKIFCKRSFCILSLYDLFDHLYQ